MTACGLQHPRDEDGNYPVISRRHRWAVLKGRYCKTGLRAGDDLWECLCSSLYRDLLIISATCPNSLQRQTKSGHMRPRALECYQAVQSAIMQHWSPPAAARREKKCFSKAFLQPGLFDTPFEENATNEKIWLLSAMPLLVPTTRRVRRQQTRLSLHLLSSDAPCVVNKMEGH